MRLYPALTISWTTPVDADRVDHLMADVDGLGATAIEELADGLRVFFLSAADRDAALSQLRDRPGMACEPIDVPDGDWAARSQAALEPITAGDITVAPPWTVTPEMRARSKHLVVIQPSMGFGTGHHATTRLCLVWLQQTPLAGAAVLDVGTGSGVLAIAASRLGAASVAGIDVDPDALESARENLELNGAAGRVALHEVGLSGAARALGRTFNVILANLTGGLLCREAGVFRSIAAPGARLIASGFQTHEAPQVIGEFQDAGWTLEGKSEEQDWVGAQFRR
jgi:ribosomal protein L11 methyltransferase